MSKIVEAIEDIINGHLSGMDFSDMITTEVRECWDMDDLDRIDEMDDRLETVESWITDAEDKFGPQNIIEIETHIGGLMKEVSELKNRLKDYEDIREMAFFALEPKASFFQKLMFWR